MAKFTVTFKDPDGPSECLTDEAKRQVAEIQGLTRAEQQAVFSARREALEEAVRKWFWHGEYVDIEIDTEAGTATVLPAKD